MSLFISQEIRVLASCPLAPVTANGVDVLTEMYVIYMETDTHRSNGCSRRERYTQMEGRKARKYMMMFDI